MNPGQERTTQQSTPVSRPPASITRSLVECAWSTCPAARRPAGDQQPGPDRTRSGEKGTASAGIPTRPYRRGHRLPGTGCGRAWAVRARGREGSQGSTGTPENRRPAVLPARDTETRRPAVCPSGPAGGDAAAAPGRPPCPARVAVCGRGGGGGGGPGPGPQGGLRGERGQRRHQRLRRLFTQTANIPPCAGPGPGQSWKRRAPRLRRGATHVAGGLRPRPAPRKEGRGGGCPGR